MVNGPLTSGCWASGGSSAISTTRKRLAISSTSQWARIFFGRAKRKKYPPPAAPSVIGSHEFEGDSGNGPYRVGSDILVTAIQNPFDDTKKWPMAKLPNGNIARITCMPEDCVYIPYGSKCQARVTGITSQATSVAILKIIE